MKIPNAAWPIMVAALVGCGPEIEHEAEVASSIEFGADDISTPTRNAVVLIGGTCTGTLVAPDLVLTAIHCGFESRVNTDGSWRTLTPPVSIDVGPTRGSTTRYSGIAISTPPVATRNSEVPFFINADIVLIRLQNPIPSSVAVPRPVLVDRPTTLGASTWIFQIGYGGGRDRRLMTGRGYRDWLSGHHLGVNYFAYEASIRGPGIGDDRFGTNIEGGDSGGPMLFGSATGAVMGVLSHWEPTGVATFGPGGSGRPSVRAWLIDNLAPLPDLEITSITSADCTSSGGKPNVSITLRNNGHIAARAPYVDVFAQLPSAPDVGELSEIYRRTTAVPPLSSRSMSFALPRSLQGRRIWVDAIVDTIRGVPESNENNNVESARVTLPDCTFN